MASPEERSRAARIAALTRWSKQDPREGTAPARAAWHARFEDQVDPDRRLDPAERSRRAHEAMRRHMRLMALRREQAKGRKREVADATS